MQTILKKKYFGIDGIFWKIQEFVVKKKKRVYFWLTTRVKICQLEFIWWYIKWAFLKIFDFEYLPKQRSSQWQRCIKKFFQLSIKFLLKNIQNEQKSTLFFWFFKLLFLTFCSDCQMKFCFQYSIWQSWNFVFTGFMSKFEYHVHWTASSWDVCTRTFVLIFFNERSGAHRVD